MRLVCFGVQSQENIGTELIIGTGRGARKFMSVPEMKPGLSRNHRNRGGFSVLELMVVILIVSIAASILLMRHRNARFHAATEECLNRGKNLYMTIGGLGKLLPNIGIVPTNFYGICSVLSPSSRPSIRFKNSTEYFASFVDSNIYLQTGCIYIKPPGIAVSYFAPPGTDVAPAKDNQEFQDGTLRNIWCRSLDIGDETLPGTPFLFTQNFKFESSGPDATLDQMVGLESCARPFGDKAGIVIQYGGAGCVLNKESASLSNFCAVAKFNNVDARVVKNKFLWPLSTGQDLQ